MEQKKIKINEDTLFFRVSYKSIEEESVLSGYTYIPANIGITKNMLIDEFKNEHFSFGLPSFELSTDIIVDSIVSVKLKEIPSFYHNLVEEGERELKNLVSFFSSSSFNNLKASSISAFYFDRNVEEKFEEVQYLYRGICGFFTKFIYSIIRDTIFDISDFLDLIIGDLGKIEKLSKDIISENKDIFSFEYTVNL